MSAIINFLGEDLSESEQIEAAEKEYNSVLELLHAQNVDGSISVKPSQVGSEIHFNQSCHKRSAGDLLHLLEKQAIIRLVKGAYHESEQHSFHFDPEVRDNYLKLWNFYSRIAIQSSQ